MKKIAVRSISFVLVFVLLFLSIQFVLSKRWNSLYARNKDYMAAAPGSIDVLCFGTSELWAGYDPMVTYQAEGITGYNFAITYKSGLTAYYQLLQALEYQTPKVVICDFASMYEDQIPSGNEKIEAMYCRVLDCLKNSKLKACMIRDLMKLDDQRSVFSWAFPLLRYHSLWAELTEENFMTRDEAASDYVPATKGAMLDTHRFSGVPIKLEPSLWEAESKETPFSEISMGYYDKLIDTCLEKGIQVVCVVPPKVGDAGAHMARWQQQKAYFDQKGVDCLDYNTYEQTVERIGLTLERDYYDVDHLNIPGSVKFSTVLAKDLKERYDLTDHRTEDAFKGEWTDQCGSFAYTAVTEARDPVNCIDTIRGLGLLPVVSYASVGEPSSGLLYQRVTCTVPDVQIELTDDDAVRSGEEGEIMEITAMDAAGNSLCSVRFHVTDGEIDAI